MRSADFHPVNLQVGISRPLSCCLTCIYQCPEMMRVMMCDASPCDVLCTFL